MRFPRKLVGPLLAAGMAASAIAAAAPANASTTYYVFGTTVANLSNADTGMCLEADAAPDFAYRIETQPCNLQNPAQQWTAVAQGGGISKLVNHAVGWCMDAYTSQGLVNAPIILWDCSSSISNENWQLIISTLGYGFIESRVSNSTGHSLSIPGGQILAGLWTLLQADTNAADGSQLLHAFTVSVGGSGGTGSGGGTGGGGCATGTPAVSGHQAAGTPNIIACP